MHQGFAPPEWFATQWHSGLYGSIYLLWMLAEILNFTGITRPRAPGMQLRDRGSLWVILVGIFGSISAVYGARYGLSRLLLPGWVYWPGVILMLLGIALRQWAIAVLGRFFSPAVVVQHGHHLIQRGPYRVIRHPSYAGSIVTLVGVSLALRTWPGLLAALVITLVIYGYRMSIEEEALRTAFGQEYERYAQRTWRLLPYLY
jgi:protein-S-isoprenylcysteine O-methyltransferase